MLELGVEERDNGLSHKTLCKVISPPYRRATVCKARHGDARNYTKQNKARFLWTRDQALKKTKKRKGQKRKINRNSKKKIGAELYHAKVTSPTLFGVFRSGLSYCVYYFLKVESVYREKQ